jgi:hypothetical protein
MTIAGCASSGLSGGVTPGAGASATVAASRAAETTAATCSTVGTKRAVGEKVPATAKAITIGLKLQFRAAPGKAPLAVAVDVVSGCPEVGLTIGGKQQPALAGLSAEKVFKIAGLGWTVPGSPGKR